MSRQKQTKNEGHEYTSRMYKRKIKGYLENAHPIIEDYLYYIMNMQVSSQCRYINEAKDFYNYCMEYTGEQDPKAIFSSGLINTETVRRYLWTPKEDCQEEISHKTFNLRRTQLKKFCDFLRSCDILDTNYFSKGRIERADADRKSQRPSLTQKEVKVLLSNITNPSRLECSTTLRNNIERFSDMWYVFTSLAIITGARFAELANLTYDDIDTENKQIKFIQKGNKVRFNTISDDVIELLEEYRPVQRRLFDEVQDDIKQGRVQLPKLAEPMPDNQLFFSPLGSRLSNKYANKIMDVCSQDVGKHVTCHVLRHTCANFVMDDTKNIYIVQDMLGHADISTTMNYLHINSDELKGAVKRISGSVLLDRKLKSEQEWV